MKEIESVKCIRCNRWARFGLKTCRRHTPPGTVPIYNDVRLHGLTITEAREKMEAILSDDDGQGEPGA